jgi:hypothetical protein
MKGLSRRQPVKASFAGHVTPVLVSKISILTTLAGAVNYRGQLEEMKVMEGKDNKMLSHIAQKSKVVPYGRGIDIKQSIMSQSTSLPSLIKSLTMFLKPITVA